MIEEEKLNKKVVQLLSAICGGGLLLTSLQSGRAMEKVFAQGVDCDWTRTITHMDGRYLLGSGCEGPVQALSVDSNLTQENLIARSQQNVLTRNLGPADDPYRWLNIPYQGLVVDSVSGERMNSDDVITNLLRSGEDPKMIALRDRINQYASAQLGYPTAFRFGETMDFYLDHTSTDSNRINQLSVNILRNLGVNDYYLVNGRIWFDQDGSPISLREWQTRIGTGVTSVEESTEGWINLSWETNAITRHGARRGNLPISIKLIPNNDYSYYAMVIIDKSCGNFIEMYPIPFRAFVRAPEIALVATPEAIATAALQIIEREYREYREIIREREVIIRESTPPQSYPAPIYPLVVNPNQHVIVESRPVQNNLQEQRNNQQQIQNNYQNVYVIVRPVIGSAPQLPSPTPGREPTVTPQRLEPSPTLSVTPTQQPSPTNTNIPLTATRESTRTPQRL